MTTSTISLEEHLIQKTQWESTVVTLKDQVKYLEGQLEWFKKQIFGQKSERVIDTQRADAPCLPGFEEFFSRQPKAEESTQSVPAHERRKRQCNKQDAISFPSDLPLERQVIDIPEQDKVCQETGLPLVKIGEEITTKL